MLIKDIFKRFDEIIPIENAADWDNSGEQIQFSREVVNRVLTTLEVTNDVIDEAISRKCNLILSHHPLIFSKINTISDMQPKQKMIMRLISNKISVYSAHTNYDIAEGGTSDYLTKQLALDDIGVIPETDGFAVQGMLKVEMNLSLILILMSMMRRMIFLQVYIRASQGRTDLDFLNILQGLPQDMAEKHF